MIRATLFCAMALVVVFAPSRTPAATLGFDATLKGVSETFNGDKFPYTGTGTMTFDDVAGTVTYSFQLSNGLTFSGDGTAAVTAKGRIFGVVSAGSPGIDGSAVIEGKANKDRTKFNAKIFAAIPNRLGPPPNGFVISKIKVKGTLQE